MSAWAAQCARSLHDVRAGASAARAWSPLRWALAALVALGSGLAMGVPTGIVHTSLYTRMTPVTWWDYPVWAASALLLGLTAATYLRADVGERPSEGSRRTVAAAVMSTFAVGCPICNKLVVAAVGVSGALSLWAPIQPVLGVATVVMLAGGLAVRLRGAGACRVDAAR